MLLAGAAVAAWTVSGAVDAVVVDDLVVGVDEHYVVAVWGGGQARACAGAAAGDAGALSAGAVDIAVVGDLAVGVDERNVRAVRGH